MRETLSIQNMTHEQLLEAYTYAVQRAHYDPVHSAPSPFSVSELFDELLKRLGDRGENTLPG